MTIRLRDGYDLGECLSSDPLVQVVDDYVLPDERAHVIDLARDSLQTALVSAVGESVTSAGRTGSVAWLAHDATPVVRHVVERVSELVGLPVGHAESLQVLHYGRTEQYRPHFDGWDMHSEKGQQRLARGGQRLVTALCYLNDVEAGGSTVFPRLDLEIEARPGRMVIFHNVADPDLADLTRHPRSLHGGSPVWRGEKWACNLWFRHRPYQADAVSGSGEPPRTETHA
ncbi:MAG: 2OG-Fe(II) oxygenase [Actinomycetota bacterium]